KVTCTPDGSPRSSVVPSGLSRSFCLRRVCCLAYLLCRHHLRGLLPTAWLCPSFCRGLASVRHPQQSCSSGRQRPYPWHDSCCPSRRAQGCSRLGTEERYHRAHSFRKPE